MDIGLRTQIWNELVTNKFRIYYYDEHIKRISKYNRILNTILSLVAFSSMSVWAITSEHPKLWAAIISLTAIYSFAIKPYYSFEKSLLDLRKLNTFLTQKFLYLEILLHDLDYNYINSQYAHDLYFKIREEIENIDDIIDIPSYKNDSIEGIARLKTLSYLKNIYGINP